MTIRASFPSLRPSLDLHFARTKRLDPRVTFSRDDSQGRATYFDAGGVLRTAAIGAPRFDHDPSTGESLGLLVEESRTNLLLQSEDFSTSWAKDTNSTLTTNAAAAPSGSIAADKFAVGTSTFPQISQSVASPASSTHCVSIYAKPDGIDFIQLRLRDPGATNNTIRVDVNLQTAQTLTVVSGNGIVTSASAVPVGSGWLRIMLIGIPNNTGTSIQPLIVLAKDLNGTVATSSNSNATDGVLIWGAQLEAGAFPTSYIKTEAATATRAADLASITGTNFSSWYNQSEGTVFFEGRTAQGTAATPWSLFGINSLNRIGANYTTLDRMQSFSRLDSVFEALLSTVGGTAPLNTFGKGATGYKVNDFGFSWNGAAALTDNSTGLPTALQFDIGGNGGLTGNFINGHLKRLTYFSRRLSNTTLQSITR